MRRPGVVFQLGVRQKQSLISQCSTHKQLNTIDDMQMERVRTLRMLDAGTQTSRACVDGLYMFVHAVGRGRFRDYYPRARQRYRGEPIPSARICESNIPFGILVTGLHDYS